MLLLRQYVRRIIQNSLWQWVLLACMYGIQPQAIEMQSLEQDILTARCLAEFLAYQAGAGN